ncbi:MAG: hypothetical protein HN526_07915 [Gammaproteobacteria bacterium]|jgi:hypothetical protein|nr:hypothetical protein [Gammaproteobacteria bacterium]
MMNVVDEDLRKIHETIALYHDAHYYADIEKLEQAFHDEAQIVGHYHGDSFVTKRDDYKDVLTAESPPASQDEPTYIKVLAIDRTDTTSFVKLESLMRGDVFISMLTLWKSASGDWQIISGVFHVESSES